jgi:DNA-binding beta-propeller fold protein YncE
MVQLLLTGSRSKFCHLLKLLLVAAFLLVPAWAKISKRPEKLAPPPQLLMDGGRKLSWERSFSAEREVRKKPGIFGKILNFVAGDPEYHYLVRPYSIVSDSHGRVIITDPGAQGIHIFDFEGQKYKFIQRKDARHDPLREPQCVAVDAEDNFYVTDSEAGKIFVFGANGKLRKVMGSLKGGEGLFKRPTGIAVDSAAGRIYVSDTLRNQVFILDMNGAVLKTIGENGSDPGQFNYPTEILLNGENLAVVDAMNFRVEVFDRSGNFKYAVGKLGDDIGTMFRPKGIGFDSEGHLYVVEGLRGTVQVFNREGQLLYYFGGQGAAAGQFLLPSGLFIDHKDRIFVVDSYNRRVQVFQYQGVSKKAGGME